LLAPGRLDERDVALSTEEVAALVAIDARILKEDVR